MIQYYIAGMLYNIILRSDLLVFVMLVKKSIKQQQQQKQTRTRVNPAPLVLELLINLALVLCRRQWWPPPVQESLRSERAHGEATDCRWR